MKVISVGAAPIEDEMRDGVRVRIRRSFGRFRSQPPRALFVEPARSYAAIVRAARGSTSGWPARARQQVDGEHLIDVFERRDGTAHLVMSPPEYMQRLAVQVPRLHLIRFGVRITSRHEVSGPSLREHGVLAPNAKLRAMLAHPGPAQPERATQAAAVIAREAEPVQGRTGRIRGCLFSRWPHARTRSSAPCPAPRPHGVWSRTS